MNVLIIYAHHEPTSFNGAMVVQAVETLSQAGHEVRVSDLYAMKFDPVSDRRNFTTVANARFLDQQFEERHAAAHGGFTDDIVAEMDKVDWCDLLIFQFPLWWMGMPAIMKGWIDRVFALDFAYGGGRWFENGWLVGKKAMLSVTVGGTEQAYSRNGMYGSFKSIVEPINHGVLGFVGLSVVDPFVVYGPGRLDDHARIQVLQRFGRHLLTVVALPEHSSRASKS